MKPFRLLPLVLLACFSASAQHYSYSVSTGLRQFIFELRPNARLVYPPPKNDVLSDWQSIPFPWSFYGTPVSGFYISDNGYITFDSSASASLPDNTVLPNATGPRNAIFAFWEDLHTEAGFSQWSNEVRVLEWGTSPNRVLVIMWTGVVPPGVNFSSNNTLAFAIALMEGGDFDVIFVGGSTTVRMNATIGAQNADGSAGTMVDGSPNIRYPAVTADPNDDITYSFSYSSSAMDLAMNQHFLQPMVTVNTPVTIKGMVNNVGTTPITGFDVSWSLDGGPTHKETMTGYSIASGKTALFTHPVSWTPDTAGRSHQLRLWISSVNGGNEDTNPDNDTLAVDVFVVLGRSGEKRVLVEEFTGAWCGWCPDGGLQMAAIEAQLEKAVLVAIHAGGTDSMIVPEGAVIAAAFKPSYPQAMVDRTQFPGLATVPFSRSNNAWLNRAMQQLQTPTPVSLRVNTSFAPGSRTLGVDVTVAFDDFLMPGDHRLHVVVVEDRVTGSGRGYDQSNYYSGNTSYPNHPYFGETNPMKDFVHRHVARIYPTGDWGEAIPEGIPAGSEHSRSFTLSLPGHVREQEVTVVAFVSNHNADLSRREVLNVNSAQLFPHTGAETVAPAELHIGSPYPNPASYTSFVRIDLPVTERIRIDLIDALGRSVAVPANGHFDIGRHDIALPVIGLPGGAYIVRVMAGTRVFARPLLVLPAR